jgi:hypothetical protein
MMVPVFDFVLSIRITSGVMTLCMTGRGMGGGSGCSRSWMNTAGNAPLIDVGRKFTHDAAAAPID